MSLRRASKNEVCVAKSGTRLQQVLKAGFAHRTTESVGVYASPPSTSTPQMADALAAALRAGENKRQIDKLRTENSAKYNDEVILLASAGKSKKADMLELLPFAFAKWDSGFLYMAFTPNSTNVVNTVNELNMMNIAHVWLMPDGTFKSVTKESMKEWKRKWIAAEERGMNVPVHWVGKDGELLPAYTPA